MGNGMEYENVKEKVNMTDWELYIYEGRYNLSGYADHHPRLGSGVYVNHTSSLQRYSLEEDVLTYETRNTIYICPLKYMTLHPYLNVIPEYKEELTHRAECSDNCLDKIIGAAAKIALALDDGDEFALYLKGLQADGQEELSKREEEENKRLMEAAGRYDDCVYLEITVSVEQGNKLAYHLGEHFGIVAPDIHVGTFHDSVLYMKYGMEDEVRLDFRYFPIASNAMDTYSWSNNIKCAVIKNSCEWVVYFNHQLIQPGETKIFTPK